MRVQGSLRRELARRPDNHDMPRLVPHTLPVLLPTPTRARRIAALALLGASAALAAVGPARADIAPTLAAELNTAGPADEFTVIVSLAAQVDPAGYADDPLGLLAAKRALADQTQPAIAAAAGVPVILSLWSINALVFDAPAATIERLAAMPE